MAHLIELFTTGDPGCEGWLVYADQLASSGDCYALRVWDAHEEREARDREKAMQRYGIKELPAIVCDGELLAW